ncbi:tyrosine-type recombinase/integrase [Streptococcus pluranimalium]
MKIREYKTKSGAISYRTSLYLGIDVLTGKKVTTSISAKSKTALKQKEKAILKEWHKNGQTKLKNQNIQTVEELVEHWKKNNYHAYKFSSQNTFNNQLDYYIIPAFGKIKLNRLTRATIQQTVNEWATAYNSENQKGYKLYADLYNLLKRILAFGVSLGVLTSNPANDVLVPKRKFTPSTIKHFEPEQLKVFLNHLTTLDISDFNNILDVTLYKFLLATGCRIGEVLALEWSDIDFDNGQVSITKSLQRHGKVGTTKTKAGNRVISIDKATVLQLRLYRARQQQIALTSNLVFGSRSGYLNQCTLRNRLKIFLKECDIPVLGFHAFRHSHASLMINAGMQPKELQYRLGHSNISTTLDVYSHLSKDKEKEAVAIFENALASL